MGTGRRMKNALSFARTSLVAVTGVALCVGGNLD